MASASVPPAPEDESLLDPLLFSQLESDHMRGRYDEDAFISRPGKQQQYNKDNGQLGSSSRPNYFTTRHLTPSGTTQQATLAASWGAPGDGFAGALGSSDEPQRVPYTPSLHHSSSARTDRMLMTADRRLDFSFAAPEESSGRGHIALRPVSEIPEKYRSVFKEFPYFNFVQSKTFDDVLYSDLPLVTSAPTGSGKTVIFELAIVRLLQQIGQQISTVKIVYVAPMKALCSERFADWQTKFGPLGLRCCELTGDSQLDDYFELQSAQIVMTTPEKWDSMTRKWRDHKSLVQLVRLFLIDEVHQLNDDVRGPTVEAIVSRMKTIRAVTDHCGTQGGGGRGAGGLRFIAVSATIPNITDLCSWLGTEDSPALEYKIDESHRPVRLRKVVLSYPSSGSDFKFNLSLNYRISGVIHTYSDQKPSLVFCATRKGTQQAAATLVKDARFIMNSEHKRRLNASAALLRDGKLRDLVVCGVGYHHAGMDIADRKAIEAMFTLGDLPVLFSTSTLAMGVNLPAHLVVVKSTKHYVQGMFQEYTESQVLQMIGRAGRPQFDTTATAVIMTSHSSKQKYEALLGGKQMIESCLHHNLIEHLNAEIVLNTITDVSIALDWLHSTFFYIRVKQNPKHYNFPEQTDKLEGKLQELLVKDLNLLEKHSLIAMDDGFILQPTDTGRLMARYCVAFKSMQCFLSLHGREGLEELVGVVSQCQEFADVHLRMSEKRVLNTLNRDKNRATIRFPMNGKIKSKDMKVNCLLQAALSCLPVQEFSLNQDTQKIFRSASRLSKCLLELRMLGAGFTALLNSVLLHKCIQARLWENSKHVARQLDKIGVTISTTLVNAGLTTFDKIHAINPRELELIVNRHAPFGTQIRDAVSRLPRYAISLDQSGGQSGQQAELVVTVSLTNHSLLSDGAGATPTLGHNHTSLLLVGDSADNVLCKQRIRDAQLLSSGQFSRKLTVHRAADSDEIQVHYISMECVGLDIHEVFTPRYTGVYPMKRSNRGHTTTTDTYHPHQPPSSSVGSVKSDGVSKSSGPRAVGRRPCNHRCINKDVCGHDCCRNGLTIKKVRICPKINPVCSCKPLRSKMAAPSNKSHLLLPASGSTHSTSTRKRQRPNAMTSFLNDLHARGSSIPETPALKRIKPTLSMDYQSAYSSPPERTPLFPSHPPPSSLQSQYSYTPRGRMEHSRYSEPRSRLVDDIYEDSVAVSAEGERGRMGPYQEARRAAERDSALGKTTLHEDTGDVDEMGDFEDYIWEEWEEGRDHIESARKNTEQARRNRDRCHPAYSNETNRQLVKGQPMTSTPPDILCNKSRITRPTTRASRGRKVADRFNIHRAPSTIHKLPPTSSSSFNGAPVTRAPTTIHTFSSNSSSSFFSSGTPVAVSGVQVASSSATQPRLTPPPPPSHSTHPACSFFTAAPPNASEEDGCDLFGSVFAGIF